jgi:hypothetical protein
MTQAGVAIDADVEISESRRNAGKVWPLALGFAVLAVPTLQDLVRHAWSTEFGA